MEWVAAMYAMGDIIKQNGPSAVEDVIFALLEGDPMYVDVFMVTMTGTPFIGPEDLAKEKIILFHEFKDSRHHNQHTRVHHDQRRKPSYHHHHYKKKLNHA